MNKLKNYIEKLEKWFMICDEIIKDGNDFEINYRAQELKAEVETDLAFYRKEFRRIK